MSTAASSTDVIRAAAPSKIGAPPLAPGPAAASAPWFAPNVALERGLAAIASALSSTLARSAAGSFALNVTANALALVTAILLARTLGPADYGVYALALIWANLLGFVATLGFPQLIVREVARLPGAAPPTSPSLDATSSAPNASPSPAAQASADLLATSTWLTLATAIGLATAGILLAPLLLPAAGGTAQWTFTIGMLMIAPIALQRLREAAALGAHHPVASLLPERLVRPACMLAAVVALALAGSLAGNARLAMMAQLAVSALTLVAAVWIARRALAPVWHGLRANFTPQVVRQALPFLFIGLTTLLATRLDMIMLGFLAEATEIGHYRLASQIAAVALLVATASQAILSPEISRRAGADDLAALRRQIVRFATTAGAVTVLGAIVMLVGFHLAQPMIGESYAAAREPLIILLAAYVAVAILFPALPLLTMTGHTRLVGWANVAALVVNAILNLALIPSFGGNGAAFATLASLVLLYAIHAWNVARLGLLTPFRL